MIILGTRIINPNATGSIPVQQKDISWSYLSLGNEALTQMKMNRSKHTFNPKANPSKDKNVGFSKNAKGTK